MGRTSVYVSVSSNGRLLIEGSSSIIEKINGEGMKEKVQDPISGRRRKR